MRTSRSFSAGSPSTRRNRSRCSRIFGKIASPWLTPLNRPRKYCSTYWRASPTASEWEQQQQFENLTASSLYCDKCKTAMPVRERLLLVLPDKEIFDYLCTGCGSSVGQREVTAGEKLMAQHKARRRRPRRARPCINRLLTRE